MDVERAMRGRFAPLLATALAALAARAAVFCSFLQTPLDFYVKFEGLDMKFIHFQGESFYHLHGILSVHRLLCAVSMLFTGGSLSPTALAAAQMILGALGAVLVCDAVLRISGSRLAALASGLLAATYAPALMYETLVLKESVCVFMASLSLWTVSLAGVSRRGAWAGALHGAAAAAMPLARFAGLLWSLSSIAWLALRKAGSARAAKKSWIPAAAFLAALALAWAFNFLVLGDARLFETNASYNLQLGASGNPSSYSGVDKAIEALPAWKLLLKAAEEAPAKALCLLKAYQIPDNVNYYFLREAMPPLKSLPGPMLLVPLGLAGLLLGLLKTKGNPLRKEALPALQFASLALPLCLFIVTGRHMLYLAPSLCAGAGVFVAAFAASCLKAARSRSVMKPALLAGALALLAWQAVPNSIPLRADDFIAYGLASELKRGPTEEAGRCFANALNLSPDSVPAAVNLGKWLIESGSPAQAADFLRDFAKRSPGNFKIMLNFSTALLMSGGAAEAEKSLEAFPKNGLSPEQTAKLLFNLSEARRLQGKAAQGAQP